MRYLSPVVPARRNLPSRHGSLVWLTDAGADAGGGFPLTKESTPDDNAGEEHDET
jgi:hypothetical protein